ncbi:MAG: hypothetical protein QOE84_1318 [Actinomycetota bacterium]|jgi:hypothetical protein|nr:hypothetical protein [Actinomycetota bacterium]
MRPVARHTSLLSAALAVATAAALVAAPAASAGSQKGGPAAKPSSGGAPNVRANTVDVAGTTSDAGVRFPTNKQNEPSIAVSSDGVHLVAGTNDEQEQPPCGPGPVRGSAAAASDCSFFPGVGTDGVYTSADGGTTWVNRGLLDDQASWRSSPYVSDGDPAIVYGTGPTGGQRVYYAGLASFKSGLSPYNGGFGGAENVVVSFSDDNGVTWSAPVAATTKANPVTFNDKNSIAVGPNGMVYVAFTAFRSNGNGSEPIVVTRSSDYGRSFGPENQLSPAGNNRTGNGRQGSAIAVSGTNVYVAFEQGFSQVVAISRDAGATYSRPQTIGPVADIDDPIPGASFRTDSFASIATGPNNTVYASWSNKTAAGGAIVLASSSNGAASWSAPVTASTSGYAFFQGLSVAANGRVDLAWQALTTSHPETFGTGNASIDSWYRSWSGGSFTAAPAKISTRSSDPAASAQNNLQLQFWGDYNTMVSTNTRAWFIHTDSRNGVGCPAVDAFQRFQVNNGLAASDGEDEVLTGRTATGTESATKPAPPTDCPASYGNTDPYVELISP